MNTNSTSNHHPSEQPRHSPAKAISEFGADLLSNFSFPTPSSCIPSTAMAHCMHSARSRSHLPYELGMAPVGRYSESSLDAVTKYFAQHNEKESSTIGKLADSIPSMDRRCKLSFCIPVASTQEESYLPTTVKTFCSQTAKADSYELILVLNRLTLSSEDEAAAYKRLCTTIAGLQQEYPTHRVHGVSLQLTSDQLRIGFLRKLGHDIAVWRFGARGIEDHSYAMLRTDADITAAHPEFVEHCQRLAAKSGGKVPLINLVAEDRRELSRDPLLLFASRLREAILLVSSHEAVGGANSLVSVPLYVAAGGYSRVHYTLEDSSFDMRAQRVPVELPSEWKTSSGGGRGRLLTSARRSAVAVSLGIAPTRAWEANSPVEFASSTLPVRSGTSPAPRISWDQLDTPEFLGLVEDLATQTLRFHSEAHADQSAQFEYLRVNILDRFFGVVSKPDGPVSLRLRSIEQLKGQLRLFRELHAQ